MKYGILTNGETFAVQRINWLSKSWLYSDFCGQVTFDDFCDFGIKEFKTDKQAEECVIENFGTASERVREWRPL